MLDLLTIAASLTERSVSAFASVTLVSSKKQEILEHFKSAFAYCLVICWVQMKGELSMYSHDG